MKKHIAILFLFLAYAILFSHNIVPHHHHDTDHDLAAHHRTGHPDHCEEENKDPNHLFCLYIHSSDSFTTANHHKISGTFSKQGISLVAVLPGNFSFGTEIIPLLLKSTLSRPILFSSPHSLSSGLRAPPTFIV